MQFGPGSYCANHDLPITAASFDKDQAAAGAKGSPDAEIAAWSGGNYNKWYDFGEDEVKGYQSPREVLEFMNMIAALPSADAKCDAAAFKRAVSAVLLGATAAVTTEIET